MRSGHTACLWRTGGVFLVSVGVLLAACGGEAKLEVTITTPAEGQVLREEPFPVTGTISDRPGRWRVWLVVGSVADGQYYPVRSIVVDAEPGSAQALPWSAQFYNGVCQDTFVPGEREVMLVGAEADLLAAIADSLALKQPMSRPQLEGHLLASVVVDIQKPEPEFCLEVVPDQSQELAPSQGAVP